MTVKAASVSAVTTDLFRRHAVALPGFWAGMILLWIIVESFVLWLADDPSSIWQGFRWAPQYYMLSLGIVITAMHLPVYVAHGITRRKILTAGSVFGLVVAVGSAVVMELVFLVERGIYTAAGHTQFPDTLDLVASPGRMALVTAEFVVLYLAYFVAGWAISTGYYRFGGWWGTLLIVPAMLPPLLAESVQWRAIWLSSTISVAPEQVWVISATILALTGLLWTFNSVLLRGVAVRAK